MISNSNGAVEGPSLPKMNFMGVFNLAEQFVLQYYSVMYKCPELLHRFYGEDSTLIYESSPICGQADIHNAFCKLNLEDTRVIILKVDALKAHENSALIQVCGEISTSGGPFRRFMRSFTLLEKNPADFYVLSDIFRYQDRVYIPKNTESKVAPNLPVIETKEHSRPVQEKLVTTASPNCTEQKQIVHGKELEAPQLLAQEPETQKQETLLTPRNVTPVPTVEPVSQKEVEKQAAAPIVQTQSAPPPPRQSPQLPQQPVSSAPMSWAQRASGSAAAAPASAVIHRSQVQSSKSEPAEHLTANAPITGSQRGGSGRQFRGGGRSLQPDFRRDPNGDRRDAQQQQTRGGFAQSGGARSDMRGNPNGMGRNYGSGFARGGGGSSRGEGNAAPRR